METKVYVCSVENTNNFVSKKNEKSYTMLSVFDIVNNCTKQFVMNRKFFDHNEDILTIGNLVTLFVEQHVAGVTTFVKNDITEFHTEDGEDITEVNLVTPVRLITIKSELGDMYEDYKEIVKMQIKRASL